jgi:hypothetical protein
MTSKDKFRFTVLCEDKAHFNFVSGYLQSRGVSSRKIVANTPRPGVTSAEQYVRDHFVEEVEAYRKWAREHIVLIVVTDADKYAYDKRLKTLLDTLGEPLSKNERIVILIPTRNIETWFCYADKYADKPVEGDEQTDYKSKYKRASPSTYGKEYAENICPSLPVDALPALQEARMEVERLRMLLS